LFTNAQVSFRCVFLFGLQMYSFSAIVVTYDSKILVCSASGLALALGLQLGIGLGVGLGLGMG